MADAKGPPKSLDALFGSKAKKKPKASNMNAGYVEPPAPAPKPRIAPKVVDPNAVEGWERALRKDQDLLKACGLWIKEVEADGACLFRAFADQLDAAGPSEHAKYRERCVDFIEAHRQDFEPFLEQDFGEYCARMRQASAWGGHVEVQALARALGVNTLIYQPTEAGRPESLLSTCVEVLTEGEDDSRCVQLSFHPQHHAGQHYNSVRCVDDAGESPALVASVPELRRRIDSALKPEPAAEATPAAEEKAFDRKARAKVF
jgi:hypothetical protein